MFHREYLRSIVLSVVAVGIWVLSVGFAHGQMKCYYNPDVQCQACSGKIGNQCCWNYACADGTGDQNCGACSQARMRTNKLYILNCVLNTQNERTPLSSGEAILFLPLRARDMEIEHALLSLK